MSNIKIMLSDLGNFGVSHYLCPADCDLVPFLDAAVECGFTSIGLTERALSEMPIAELRRELRSRQLGVSSVNTAGYFLFEGERRTQQARINESLLCAASELEAVNGVNLIVGGTASIPLSEARDDAFEQSCALAQRAKSLGTRLLIEPMHPIQTTGKGCVNTLEQAHAWTQAIDGLALNLDLFHSWWDPSLPLALQGEMSPLGVVQICDVSINAESMLPCRVPLGQGQIDWRNAVRHLVRSFRHIPIELELFAFQLSGRDPLDVMRVNARIIETVLRETEK